MRSLIYPSLCAGLLLAFAPFANAQSHYYEYVDVQNSEHNAQVHFPESGYAYFPSSDYLGVGYSFGFGTYHIADGFLTGSTTDGLWKSFWYDANMPDPDIDPHGGSGTIDIMGPGGIEGANAAGVSVILGNGLPSHSLDPNDTDGLYIGIYGEPTAGYSEYALWHRAIVVDETTSFNFQYLWANAGATLGDGTEILEGVQLGATFFVTTEIEYNADAITFAEDSTLRTYEGAGTQEWTLVEGTFTLDPGVYYWGFSATGDAAQSYITVDQIMVASIPEPSGVVLSVAGAGMLFTMLRRRSRRA